MEADPSDFVPQTGPVLRDVSRYFIKTQLYRECQLTQRR